MTHNTAKGDMRVVRDEMEKKREEGRAEWVRAQQRERGEEHKEACIFSFFFFFYKCHNKTVGDGAETLSACALLHHLPFIK